MITSDIPHIAKHLMEKHGIAQRGWTFRWDNARSRAGCCRYYRKTVTLSRHYVALNVAERLDDIIDTILHEIAHALVGPGKGHGPEWKQMAAQIGAKPERCYDSAVIVMPKGRFAATCGGCGREFRKHKTKHLNNHYCVACGVDRGRLKFVDTSVPSVRTAQHPPIQDTPPTPRRLRG